MYLFLELEFYKGEILRDSISECRDAINRVSTKNGDYAQHVIAISDS